MEEIIEKWVHARDMQREWEKKTEHYRSMAQDMMAREHLDVYETGTHRVKKQVQQREVMSKKMVPPEVWSQYALPQRLEFLVLSSKNENKKKKE